MALSSQTYRTEFSCIGGTTYDFTFKVFDDDDLEVIRITAAGVESTLTKTTNYSVSGLSSTGGTVTTVSTYSDGKLVVRRKQAATQDADFTQNDILSTEVLEDQLDKIVMMVQDLKEKIARSLLGAATQTSSITFPAAEAEKVIGWDTAGTGLENKVALDEDSVTACSASQVAAAASAATAVAAAAKVPDITASDANKVLHVKSDYSAAEWSAGNAASLPAILDANGRLPLQVKTVAYTRDAVAATGNVTYTGAGFYPKIIMARAAVAGTSRVSFDGWYDGATGQYCLRGVPAGGFAYSGNLIDVRDTSDSNYQVASVSGPTSDGCIITWTKSASTAVGTIDVVLTYIA